MENVDLTVLKPEDATLLRAVPVTSVLRGSLFNHLLVLGWRVRHRGNSHAGWQRQLGPMGEAGRGGRA